LAQDLSETEALIRYRTLTLMEALLLTLEVLLNKESQTLSSLCRVFFSQTGTSLTRACGQRPIDFLARYPKRFAVAADGVSLSSIRRERMEMSESEWLATAALLQGTESQDENVNAFVAYVKNNLCIECHVELAGSVGRKTSTRNCRDADVVLVLSTPMKDFDRMSTSVLAMLPALLGNAPIMHESRKINFTIGQPDLVNKFVPCTIDGQDIRVFVAPKEIEGSSERQLTAWVASQPATVLHAIRIVKEWSAAQTWSSEYLTPSAMLLELMVIHASKHVGSSVGDVVEATHTMLRDAEDVRVTFDKAAIEKRMPLVVDPYHPARNHADPAVFDPIELSRFADESKSLGQPRARCIESDSTASFISASSSGPSSDPSTDRYD